VSREIITTNSARHRGRWSLLVAVVLGVVLLALAIRGVVWSEVLTTIRRIGFLPLVAAVPILTGSYVLRGLRWAILLRAEAPVPSSTAVWASFVGYLANGFLPARAGEPIRAVLVSQHSPVSTSGALATALSERLVDAALLTVIAITGVATASALPEWLRGGAWTMAGAALLGLLGLFVAPRFQPLLARCVARLPVSARWKERITRWLGQFLHGLRALHSRQRALPVLAVTVLIWLIDASVVVVVARTANLSISFPQALILLSALGLASAAPSTPGYLGIYQFVAVSVLEPFGLSRSEALVFIVLFQAVVYVVIMVGGGLGLSVLAKRAARTSARARLEAFKGSGR
jgi:hypothetical protein